MIRDIEGRLKVEVQHLASCKVSPFNLEPALSCCVVIEVSSMTFCPFFGRAVLRSKGALRRFSVEPRSTKFHPQTLSVHRVSSSLEAIGHQPQTGPRWEAPEEGQQHMQANTPRAEASIP